MKCEVILDAFCIYQWDELVSQKIKTFYENTETTGNDRLLVTKNKKILST